MLTVVGIIWVIVSASFAVWFILSSIKDGIHCLHIVEDNIRLNVSITCWVLGVWTVLCLVPIKMLYLAQHWMFVPMMFAFAIVLALFIMAQRSRLGRDL